MASPEKGHQKAASPDVQYAIRGIEASISAAVNQLYPHAQQAESMQRLAEAAVATQQYQTAQQIPAGHGMTQGVNNMEQQKIAPVFDLDAARERLRNSRIQVQPGAQPQQTAMERPAPETDGGAKVIDLDQVRAQIAGLYPRANEGLGYDQEAA